MATLKSCVDSLADNILNDCNDIYGKGVEKRAWIFAKEDVSITLDRENMKITAMTMKSGKIGHYIDFPADDPANGLKNEDQNAVIGMNFTKTSPLILLADSPRNAKIVRALKAGKHIIVFEKRAKDEAGEQAFIVIGAEQGAKGQDANWDAYSDDTQGGWAINLVETNATLPQAFLTLGETADATREALESMMTATA